MPGVCRRKYWFGGDLGFDALLALFPSSASFFSSYKSET